MLCWLDLIFFGWLKMSKEIIFSAVSKLSRKKISDISQHQSLGSLGINSSFGLSALRSLLEAQLGRKIPLFDLTTNIERLIILSDSKDEHNLDNKAKSIVDVANGSEKESVGNFLNLPTFSQIGLGVDIQQIDVFDMVPDFREDHFYKSHFTDSEISTATLKANPLAHFAGVFCAKEAAKKSHEDLINLRMTDFVVSYTNSGKPSLRLTGNNANTPKFQFLISITHSNEYAAATCLTFWGN